MVHTSIEFDLKFVSNLDDYTQELDTEIDASEFSMFAPSTMVISLTNS